MTANEVGGLTSTLAKAQLGDASPAKQALGAPESSHDRQEALGADKEGKNGAVNGEKSVDGQGLGEIHHAADSLSAPSVDESSTSTALPLRIQRTLSGDSPAGENKRGDVFYDPTQHTFGESLGVDGDVSGVPVSLAATGPLSASDPRTQLYVSNLPYRVRWQDLKDLFRRAGTVLRADVSLTLDNRSRGVGTVLLATEDDARRACDMFKGFNWQGRTLDVRIDRSGTLLGVGAAQLGTPHASNHGVAAPNTPLSPSAALTAGVSPVPSPASQHALGTASFGMSRSASQSGGSVHGRMSPSPSLGSPHVAAATPLSVANARQLGQTERSQMSSSLGLSPASKDARNLATNGISPALLPFLGASTRASISSPHMSGNSSPSLWNQSSTPSSLLQQRSASLSAGTPVYSPSLSANSPFSNHQTAFSPSGTSVSTHFAQRHLPLGQAALGSSPNLTGQRAVGLGPFPGMGAGVGTSFQSQVQAQQNFLLGNTTLPQAPTMVVAPQQATAYYGRVLFVGNLPFHCQWQDLKDLFRAAGNIQRADVALTPEGKSRGFGTVLFATPEDAQNAVRIYHGYEYSGRTLKVHFDRFAQMTIPPSGTLPASPSQYTGAFAAANTPTPVTNAGSASAQSGPNSFASTPNHAQPQQHHDHHQLHAFQQQNAQHYMHQQRQNQLFYPQQHPASHSNVFMHGAANEPSSMANPFRVNDGVAPSNFYAQHQQKQPLHQHRNHMPAQNYQQQQPNFQSYQQLSQQPFSSSSSVFGQYQNPFASTLSMPLRPAQPPFDSSTALDADLTQSSDGLGASSKASHSTAEEEKAITEGDAEKEDASAAEESSEDQTDSQLAAASNPAPTDGKGEGDPAKEDASSTPPASAAPAATAASAPPVSTAAHPGRIQLPPQNFVAPQMAPFSPINSRMTVPMTPGMPGFTFHALPETPPVPLHFLSPGLGGPFSPPLASPTFNGPATPGAPAARSFGSVINPAPGAPIHFANGGSTPLANVMNVPSGFNPMFPPIGAPYPAPFSYSQPQQQQTHLPQTPHWTQPRQPPSSFRQHGHAIQQMTDEHQREGNLSGGQNSAGAVGDSNGDGSGTGLGESGQSLGLHDIQASTGASNTEELARKIAQMSAEKALRQQQQQQQQRATDASPYDVSPSVDAAAVPSLRRASEAVLERMEDAPGEKSTRARESSEGALPHAAGGLDAPLELRLERKSSPFNGAAADGAGGEPNGHSAAEQP